MTKPQRLIGITLIFGVVAGVAYWLYLYISTGSAPSFSDLWGATQGGFTAVTGIGKQSYAQLYALAQGAGFSDADSDTAAAIALAESSGNPNAVGDLDITPGGSIGLWQINLKAHPEYTADSLKDPATNAAAAYAVYSNANGFTPWSTFNGGQYQAYLQSTATSDASAIADTSTGSADDATGSATASMGNTQSVVGASGNTSEAV
jgi:Lysozyme like domain